MASCKVSCPPSFNPSLNASPQSKQVATIGRPDDYQSQSSRGQRERAWGLGERARRRREKTRVDRMLDAETQETLETRRLRSIGVLMDGGGVSYCRGGGVDEAGFHPWVWPPGDAINPHLEKNLSLTSTGTKRRRYLQGAHSTDRTTRKVSWNQAQSADPRDLDLPDLWFQVQSSSRGPLLGVMDLMRLSNVKQSPGGGSVK
ncbi:hypothetical protein B0T19DRAFT_423148 [Cercophora scortea]|uniref:Uncharacterized protein n=1 Tax=Cercophora scortea TaxID=314031 RepID=A0AAE0IP39_9PEZI|nr:hypothetical protein B0T19DRAFT_423148 [Cercophora scortea]